MEFQVVRVIGECRLLDEESFEHLYCRRDGKPLVLGYYVVSWAPGARVGRYNEDAVFQGPYRLRSEALAAVGGLEARAAARWLAVPSDGPAFPVTRFADGIEDR